MKTLLSLIFVALLASLGYYMYDSQTNPREQPLEMEGTNTPSVPALTTLNRSNQGLTKLPSEILSMTNLQQLDV